MAVAPTPAPVPADAGSDLEAFVAAFDHFVRAAKHARSRAVPDDELTPSQFDLLFPLLEAPDALGLRELARAAGVSAPTATRMVDGLERRGLISRRRSADDRRAVRLTLTAAGAEAVQARRARAGAARRELFEQLDAEERQAAARVLSRLAVAYEELRR